MRSRTVAVSTIAIAGALLTACGSSGGSLGAAPTGSPRSNPPAPASSAPAATDRPAASPRASQPGTAAPIPNGPPAPGSNGGAGPRRTITFAIWLVRDGALAVTSRTRPATMATGRLALTTLIAGPTTAEAAAGFGTAIPARTTFDLSLESGVATVDLPAAFYAGGRGPARLRQAQVVYTLTQYPTIAKVGFLKDGAATGWPVGRAEYADLLPPIVVSTPIVGQRVSSPVLVAGTANVYEATVSVRVRDSRGVEVGTTFTTATCGSGCRGSYSVPVRYRVSTAQRGTVEVFAVSAEDGSDQHLIRIPVTLTP